LTGPVLCFLILHLAASLSAEALALESFHKPLDLSKRDTYSDAIDKGRDLLCFLESPSTARQSIYTTTDALEKSGWDWEYIESDIKNLAELQPAFERLGLKYDLAYTAEISWNHDRDSRTTRGQTAPVCLVGSVQNKTC